MFSQLLNSAIAQRALGYIQPIGYNFGFLDIEQTCNIAQGCHIDAYTLAKNPPVSGLAGAGMALTAAVAITIPLVCFLCCRGHSTDNTLNRLLGDALGDTSDTCETPVMNEVMEDHERRDTPPVLEPESTAAQLNCLWSCRHHRAAHLKDPFSRTVPERVAVYQSGLTGR